MMERQIWIRLIESSNTEVSGASEMPQSRGKLILFGSLAAVFLLENRSRSISIDLDRSRLES